VMDFLNRRRGLLDGIVLSGGEATVWPGLPDFIEQVRAMGFAVKLDTNGLRPDIVGDFLGRGFLDFVALDYKAPPGKFKKVTGVEKYDLFNETLRLLSAQKKVPFEVRTTVHTALLDENDIVSIIEDLKGRGFSGTYAVQNFRADNDRPTLGNLLSQTRILDCAVLPSEVPFKIEYRNFS